MSTRIAKPDYISRTNVVLDDAWGTVYKLDALTAIFVDLDANPAELRLGRPTSSGQPDWASDSIRLRAGGDNVIDQGLVEGFAYFQFRNETPGSPATIVQFTAYCRGGMELS